MLLNVLKGKIHRATVTQAELDYIGSITIDSELMEAAGIQEYELVTISDCNNGNRLETYVIAGRAWQWRNLPEWRSCSPGYRRR